MNKLALLFVSTALCASAGSGIAAKADSPAAAPAPVVAKKAAAKPTTVYCAITGDKVGDPSKSVGTSVYKGKTYYFCCAGCKPEFDKDPAKNAKVADERAAKLAAPKVKVTDVKKS